MTLCTYQRGRSLAKPQPLALEGLLFGFVLCLAEPLSPSEGHGCCLHAQAEPLLRRLSIADPPPQPSASHLSGPRPRAWVPGLPRPLGLCCPRCLHRGLWQHFTPGCRATSVTGFKRSHTLGLPGRGSEGEPHPCPGTEGGDQGTVAPGQALLLCAQLGSHTTATLAQRQACMTQRSLLPVTERAGPQHTCCPLHLSTQNPHLGESRGLSPPCVPRGHLLSCRDKPLCAEACCMAWPGLAWRRVRAPRLVCTEWSGHQASSAPCSPRAPLKSLPVPTPALQRPRHFLKKVPGVLPLQRRHLRGSQEAVFKRFRNPLGTPRGLSWAWALCPWLQALLRALRDEAPSDSRQATAAGEGASGTLGQWGLVTCHILTSDVSPQTMTFLLLVHKMKAKVQM